MRFVHQIVVGGTYFSTSSSIAHCLPVRKGLVDINQKILFFDRNSKYFVYILDYLRATRENDLDQYELPDDVESLRSKINKV